MADPSQIPPPTGASTFVPWILGGIGTALGVLWAAVQAGRAKQIATLESALEHERNERKREHEEHKEERRSLEARLEAEGKARRSLEVRLAGTVVRVRTDPAIRDSFEEEFPTGVRMLADLVAPQTKRPESDPLGLRGFDPYEKTPK